MFAVNSLLYLNQSVPPYGVSLNSQTNGTTAFPLRKCSHSKTCTDINEKVTLVISGCVLLSFRDARRSEDHARLLPVRLHRIRQNGHLAERRGNVSSVGRCSLWLATSQVRVNCLGLTLAPCLQLRADPHHRRHEKRASVPL